MLLILEMRIGYFWQTSSERTIPTRGYSLLEIHQILFVLVINLILFYSYFHTRDANENEVLFILSTCVENFN